MAVVLKTRPPFGDGSAAKNKYVGVGKSFRFCVKRKWLVLRYFEFDCYSSLELVAKDFAPTEQWFRAVCATETCSGQCFWINSE
jgi:hypothetical protein